MTFSSYILLLLVAVLPGASFAASFDCSKASTVQEKIICTDTALSELDDKLAQTYKTAISETAKKAEIQKEQKEWLRDIRNNCTSKSCLVEAYEKRINQLASPQSKSPQTGSTCPISEKTLNGAWENVSGGFFEEMAFEYSGSEREFNSWLHQRPEISGGTWEIDNCTIFIRHPKVKTMSFAFRVVQFHGDRIYLRERGDKNNAVYRRIKP